MSDKRDLLTSTDGPANTGRTRDRSGRWLKGTPSPNPTGRPATPADVKEFWKDTSEKGRARIEKLIDHPDPMVALSASKYACDRFEGKPSQSLDVTARRLDPDAVAGMPDQARAKLEALIAEAEGHSTDMQTVALDGNAQAARGLASGPADAVASGLPDGREGDAP